MRGDWPRPPCAVSTHKPSRPSPARALRLAAGKLASRSDDALLGAITSSTTRFTVFRISSAGSTPYACTMQTSRDRRIRYLLRNLSSTDRHPERRVEGPGRVEGTISAPPAPRVPRLDARDDGVVQRLPTCYPLSAICYLLSDHVSSSSDCASSSSISSSTWSARSGSSRSRYFANASSFPVTCATRRTLT